MYNPDADASPINPLPKSVIVLLCLVGGVELILQLGERGMIGGPMAIGWRLGWAREFGFYDPIFEWMRANQTFEIANVGRFLTYAFFHSGGTHILFVLVLLLALGKYVAEICGDLAVLIIFPVSAIIGALSYGLLLNEDLLLIGAYPAVYGLLGAFTWVRFVIERSNGQSGLRAFAIITFFMIIQIGFKLIYGGANDWVAELSGFFTGFALAVALAPGGRARVNAVFAKLRRQ
jgi:membrane associated rhomboid family serine protease